MAIRPTGRRLVAGLPVELELSQAQGRLTEASTQVVGILTNALGFEDHHPAARELVADYHDGEWPGSWTGRAG